MQKLAQSSGDAVSPFRYGAILPFSHYRYSILAVFALTTSVAMFVGLTTPLLRRTYDMHFRMCYDMGLPPSQETRICDRYDLADDLAPIATQGPAYMYFVLISSDKEGYKLVAAYLDPSRSQFQRSWFPFQRCRGRSEEHFKKLPTREQISDFGVESFGCEMRKSSIEGAEK